MVLTGANPDSVYADRTQKNFIDLGEDPPERHCIPLKDAPVRGAAEPLVTLVEFTDYDCDYCRQLHRGILQLENDPDVAMSARALPFGRHAQARPAARAVFQVLSAHGTQKFWQAHDALFAAEELSADVYRQVAAQLGIPEGELATAAQSNHDDARLLTDIKLGEALKVEAMPTFFVNGLRFRGAKTGAFLRNLVGKEKAGMRRLLKMGIPRSALGEIWCPRELRSD
jgi:protein-disulfide isomerase